MPPDDVVRDLERLRQRQTPIPECRNLVHKHCSVPVENWFHAQPAVAARGLDATRLAELTIRSAAKSTARWSCTTVAELVQRSLGVARSQLDAAIRGADLISALRTAPTKEDRFAILYPHFLDQVLCLLSRKLRQPQYLGLEIEDLAQEVFQQIYLKLDRLQLRDYPQLRGWMLKITWRTLRQFWKRAHAGRRDVDRVDHGIDPADLDLLADESVQRIEVREFVDLVCSWMTPAQRDVCQPLLDGLSIDDVAAVLGKQRNAVDSILKRIRERLAKQLLSVIPPAEHQPLVQRLLKGLGLEAIAAELQVAVTVILTRIDRLRDCLLERLHPSIVTFLFQLLGLDRLNGEQEAPQ